MSAAPVALVPPAAVTVTFTTPLPAGEVRRDRRGAGDVHIGRRRAAELDGARAAEIGGR